MDEFEVVEDTPEMRESDVWCEIHGSDPIEKVNYLNRDGGENA